MKLFKKTRIKKTIIKLIEVKELFLSFIYYLDLNKF